MRIEHSTDLPSAVELVFTDSGAGIDAGFLPFIFDRFRQADSSSTRAHGGLGIGLTVVRHIVELHRGSVRAESPGTGQGSSFIVTLPILAEAPRKPEEVAPAGGLPVNVDLSGLHVLLVDDEADAREVQGEILRRAGARVTVVASATRRWKRSHFPSGRMCSSATSPCLGKTATA